MSGAYGFLEGERFFGAAPEFDRYLDRLRRRAVEQQVRVIVLASSASAPPDAVWLERLEHFLRDADRLGISVPLAGVRPNLRTAITNLGFLHWHPADHIFPQAGDDADSATLQAVRRACDIAGEGNDRTHCADTTWTKKDEREACLYCPVQIADATRPTLISGARPGRSRARVTNRAGRGCRRSTGPSKSADGI